MNLHKSVLLKESVDNLIKDLSGAYFEGTVGFGGHSKEILSRLNNNAVFIGTDKDTKAFEDTTKKFADDSRVNIYNTSFTNINTLAKLDRINLFDGILVDLGVSSFQLDNAESGFSYRFEGSFDLRMDKSQGHPAYHYVNSLGQKDLADIIYQFGEEKKSRVIAKKIVEERMRGKIKTTEQMKEIIQSTVPARFLNKTLSRVFQAFRIYVNEELDELRIFLEKSVDLLKIGGRLVVISFHSLEDRIVKEYFKYESIDCICPTEVPVCVCDKEARIKLVTKKPIVPSEEEIKSNPRARSAKLRVAERI